MKIVIKINNSTEAYDLIDSESDCSHDGDNAKEVICSVYEAKNAALIAKLLNQPNAKDHN